MVSRSKDSSDTKKHWQSTVYEKYNHYAYVCPCNHQLCTVSSIHDKNNSNCSRNFSLFEGMDLNLISLYKPQIKQRIKGVKSASVKKSWWAGCSPTSLKTSINRAEDLKNCYTCIRTIYTRIEFLSHILSRKICSSTT